jgi:hypothetical protein
VRNDGSVLVNMINIVKLCKHELLNMNKRSRNFLFSMSSSSENTQLVLLSPLTYYSNSVFVGVKHEEKNTKQRRFTRTSIMELLLLLYRCSRSTTSLKKKRKLFIIIVALVPFDDRSNIGKSFQSHFGVY